MKRYFLLAMTVFFIACTNDDIPPVVDSFSLDMNDTIRNIFSIDLNATDNSGINRIELYINDTLITEGDRVPFKYSWNTLKVNDGEYSIKLIVFDSEGNKTEKLSEVVVSNCILILKSVLPSGSVYSPYYLAVSDEEGNMLDTLTFNGATQSKLKPEKEFSGDAVNIIYYRTGLYPYMSGYIHVKRGSELIIGENPVFDLVKSIRLHFRNDIPSFTGIGISTDRAYYALNKLTDTVSLPQHIPYTPGHKLLLQLLTNEGRYFRIVEINEALDVHEMTINLSSITSVEEHKVITMPAPGYSSCVISGRAKDSDVFNSYLIFSGNSMNLADLWYPEEYFFRYTTQIFFTPQGSNKSYVDEYNGSIPTAFVPLGSDIQITNPTASNFSAIYSGSFDIILAEYYNTERTIQMNLFAPSSRNTWKLPDPGVIFNDNRFNLNKYHPEFISINQFESIDYSNSYYDLNTREERLHTFDRHYQNVRIRIPQ
jgi:hypothetical protein